MDLDFSLLYIIYWSYRDWHIEASKQPKGIWFIFDERRCGLLAWGKDTYFCILNLRKIFAVNLHSNIVNFRIKWYEISFPKSQTHHLVWIMIHLLLLYLWCPPIYSTQKSHQNPKNTFVDGDLINVRSSFSRFDSRISGARQRCGGARVDKGQIVWTRIKCVRRQGIAQKGAET